MGLKVGSGINGPESNGTCIVCNDEPGIIVDNEIGGPTYFPRELHGGKFVLLPRNPRIGDNCIGEHYTERSPVYV